MSYQNILVTREGYVGVLQLNRPKVPNALSFEPMSELVTRLEELDKDETVRVVILTGSGGPLQPELT